MPRDFKNEAQKAIERAADRVTRLCEEQKTCLQNLAPILEAHKIDGLVFLCEEERKCR